MLLGCGYNGLYLFIITKYDIVGLYNIKTHSTSLKIYFYSYYIITIIIIIIVFNFHYYYIKYFNYYNYYFHIYKQKLVEFVLNTNI
jgi:hypothetical protein